MGRWSVIPLAPVLNLTSDYRAIVLREIEREDIIVILLSMPIPAGEHSLTQSKSSRTRNTHRPDAESQSFADPLADLRWDSELAARNNLLLQPSPPAVVYTDKRTEWREAGVVIYEFIVPGPGTGAVQV